ncbi:hypothetical protein TCAL_13316 [Tigriopus californicus]|uniref:Cytochrome b5 heme-binding domain-containing protein n=1 Tax=Tigriopus californicus TaxID=6832 RepID=A0A553P5Z0_TIGCA|nr:hypothetical protein TCAL_13316 [Tigriopus californicus]
MESVLNLPESTPLLSDDNGIRCNSFFTLIPVPDLPLQLNLPPSHKKRRFHSEGTQGIGRWNIRGRSHPRGRGPYSCFAGRDASRGLATFSVSAINEEYDDLSDLKPSEMEQVREWELQFSEKYTYVGKLLKPGEQPTSYSDEEDDDEDDIEEIPRHDDVNKKDL